MNNDRNLLHNTISQDAYWQVNKKIALEVGLEATILLSDLISKEKYFSTRGELQKEEWFFNQQEQIEKDTTLSQHKQRKAIKILKEKGWINTKISGLPAKQYYKINYSQLLNFLNTSPLNFKAYNNNKYNKVSKDTYNRSTDLKDITPKEKRKPHPIVEFWNDLDAGARHTDPDKKTYQKAVTHIARLRKGIFGQFIKLSPDATYIDIADREFTDEEIKKTISNMALMFKDGYWPEDKKRLPRDLATLLYNPRTQKSMFLMCFKTPPKQVKETQKTKILDLKAYQIYDDLFQTKTDEQKSILALRTNDLNRWYAVQRLKLFPLYGSTFEAHVGSFKQFVIHHKEWLESQGEQIHMAYLKPNGVNFNRFLKKIQDDYGICFNMSEEEYKSMKEQNERQRRKHESLIEARRKEREAISNAM